MFWTRRCQGTDTRHLFDKFLIWYVTDTCHTPLLKPMSRTFHKKRMCLWWIHFGHILFVVYCLLFHDNWFNKWANKVLKQYLLKGYAINERIRKEHIGELRQMVQVIGRTLHNQKLSDTIETQELLNVVVDYTYALDTLDNYDYERLTIDKITKQESFHATYENAMEAISGLREKFGGSSRRNIYTVLIICTLWVKPYKWTLGNGNLRFSSL